MRHPAKDGKRRRPAFSILCNVSLRDNSPTLQFPGIEFGLGLLLGLLSFLLAAVIRFLSVRVQRVDANRTITSRRQKQDSHVVVGSDRAFTLLGAPHTLRTRSVLGFFALLSAVVGTIGLSISALAFSGSRQLRTGEPTVKATARQGGTFSGGSSSTGGLGQLSEDDLEKYSDWFRSTGVVSLCQRRRGRKRVFYQPFVEQATGTRVFCGPELKTIRLTHENEESIENVSPSSSLGLKITPLQSVGLSSPHSRYDVHEINVNGRGYNAVCNAGEYYRGVRSGRVSQSCAFSTKNALFLGGYTTSTQRNLSGPGVVPSADDVRYYDSYSVDTGTELNEHQLMVAVTLWDLGSMSEIEVAVLSRLSLETVATPVPSFVGGFQRLQIDMPLLVTGLTMAAVVILFYATVLLWESSSRVKAECIDFDTTDPSLHSRLWVFELTCATLGRFSSSSKTKRRRGIISSDNNNHQVHNSNSGTTSIGVAMKEPFSLHNVDENQLAIRDVTQCNCDPHEPHEKGCTVLKKYHIGSAHLGRPTGDEPLEEIMRNVKMNELCNVEKV